MKDSTTACRRLDIDISTDDGVNALLAALAIGWRRKVVDHLMCGNGTRCFTTQRYLDTYVELINKGDATCTDLDMARMHLKTLEKYRVREVGKDLWTQDEEVVC